MLHNSSTERGKIPPHPKNRAQNDYERHYNVIAEMSESNSYDQLHPLILNAGDLESATRRPFSQNRIDRCIRAYSVMPSLFKRLADLDLNRS